MRDCDLHFPCILGLDLTSHQIQVDFGQCSLTLLNADTPVPLSNCSAQAMISLLLAVTPPTVEKKIRTLVEGTDIADAQKPCLLEMLYNWPAVCTDKLGHSSMITHHIYSVGKDTAQCISYGSGF